MLLKFVSLLLVPLPLVLGQAIHVIDVGEGGLIFTPNVTTASVGDKIEYHFYGPVHSVAQGNFDKPCAPSSATGFFSGGFPVNGTGESPLTFTVTINDTNPIFYYCGVPTHCEFGMVGVINPSTTNTSQTLALYKAAAANAVNTTRPSTSAQGGIVGPAAVNSSSTANSTASSSSTPTSSASAAATTSKASDASLGRSQAGWMGVVGAGVFACGVAFLMG